MIELEFPKDDCEYRNTHFGEFVKYIESDKIAFKIACDYMVFHNILWVVLGLVTPVAIDCKASRVIGCRFMKHELAKLLREFENRQAKLFFL